MKPHFGSGGHKSIEHLCTVLGDAAIADLAVAELAFQHPEHMRDLGAHLAEAAVPGTLALREVAVRLRLLLHRPQHGGRFRRSLLFGARITLVAIDRRVVLADQAVRAPCTSSRRRVHEPAFNIGAHVRLHAKYHWFPFFDELISGSRFCSLFFVDGEAAISVASTIVPPRSNSPLAARCSAIAVKIAFVRS